MADCGLHQDFAGAVKFGGDFWMRGRKPRAKPGLRLGGLAPTTWHFPCWGEFTVRIGQFPPSAARSFWREASTSARASFTLVSVGVVSRK